MYYACPTFSSHNEHLPEVRCRSNITEVCCILYWKYNRTLRLAQQGRGHLFSPYVFGEVRIALSEMCRLRHKRWTSLNPGVVSLSSPERERLFPALTPSGLGTFRNKYWRIASEMKIRSVASALEKCPITDLGDPPPQLCDGLHPEIWYISYFLICNFFFSQKWISKICFFFKTCIPKGWRTRLFLHGGYISCPLSGDDYMHRFVQLPATREIQCWVYTAKIEFYVPTDNRREACLSWPELHDIW